jgi:hypothetical protein
VELTKVGRLKNTQYLNLVFFEVVIAIEQLKKNKSPSTDQIRAGLIQAEGKTLCSDTNELNNSI